MSEVVNAPFRFIAYTDEVVDEGSVLAADESVAERKVIAKLVREKEGLDIEAVQIVVRPF